MSNTSEARTTARRNVSDRPHGDLPTSTIIRPRVSSLLSTAVGNHQVTLVSAPAGYGKTVALQAWASESRLQIAWVDLNDGSLPLRELLGVTGRGVIVIDNLNEPVTHAEAEDLRHILVRRSTTLRVVLAGRCPSPIPMSRMALSESVGFIGSAVLGFTEDEVNELAIGLGIDLDPGSVTAIHTAGAGWPVAMRIELENQRTDKGDSHPARTYRVTPRAYIAEEVLAPLPDGLADFVLRATACSQVDGEMAVLLSGDPEGAAMLARCVEHGLPLDPEPMQASASYKWNPWFASVCRSLLSADDPALALEITRRAARALQISSPVEAVELALRGRDPELASELILGGWMQMMLERRAETLEALCRSLPLPWSDRPEILLIRACCRRAAFDEAETARLHKLALDRGNLLDGQGLERFKVLTTYADLVLADGNTALEEASHRAVTTLRDQPDEHPSLYGSVLFLAGFAEMRLRQNGPHAVSLLNDASAVCLANGMEALGHRATAYSAFVLAYHGAFNEALAAIAPGTAVATYRDRAIEGAIQLTKGWVAYWRNDLDTAGQSLREAAAALDEAPAGPSTAIHNLAYVAAARGNTADLDAAEELLEQMAADGAYGIPWDTPRQTARALIAERRGEITTALEMGRAVDDGARAPISQVLIAALMQRHGEYGEARLRLARLGDDPIPYVRAHAAIVRALLADEEGHRDEAHIALERALDHSAAQGTRRCFAENADALRDLLGEHIEWGTGHTDFVEALLHELGSDPPVDFGLSPRELDILRYLRTRMTSAEIAEALFISVATVKTHQRAIYRKLGASGRREALQVAVEHGIS